MILLHFSRVARHFPTLHRNYYTTKAPSKPLRILFCGSDYFSCGSLRALHAEKVRNPQLIASIDVLCRPGKRYGRNLKQIREVPVKAVAHELGLSVYERDTFTGWNLPASSDDPINLIVAVSFGLFVPPRILKSAEYGGVNVHPSLLPNLRGPAPLQHTIIQGREFVGVTIQTLDEKTFDNGLILAQTAPKSLPIPLSSRWSFSDLLSFITPKAADLLIQSLKAGVYVPPRVSIVAQSDEPSTDLQHAPKLGPKDKEIHWAEWDAHRIDRQLRALGPLWSTAMLGENSSTRLIFHDAEPVRVSEMLMRRLDGDSYQVAFMREQGIESIKYIQEAESDSEAAIIFLSTNPNVALRVRHMTLANHPKGSALSVLKKLRGSAKASKLA